MTSRLFRALSCVVLALLAVVGPGPDASAAALTGTTICLDPGHGGADPGAVNLAYNVRESEINLDVAYGLKALLEQAGATIIMTRTGNQGKTERDRQAFCSREGVAILVSVHTNSVADPEPNGALTLYGKPEDIPLAEAIHSGLYSTLKASAPQPAAFTDFGVRRYRATVLRRSTLPAALAEPLFLSNPAEAPLLVQSIYTTPGSGKFSPGCVDFSCRRGQIVRAIYTGIMRYFSRTS